MAVAKNTMLNECLLPELVYRGITVTSVKDITNCCDDQAVNSDMTIQNAPQHIRHSCLETGITLLYRNEYPVMDDRDGSVVNAYWYCCASCGKLFLYYNTDEAFQYSA